jgi:hypothetical protein
MLGDRVEWSAPWSSSLPFAVNSDAKDAAGFPSQPASRVALFAKVDGGFVKGESCADWSSGPLGDTEGPEGPND